MQTKNVVLNYWDVIDRCNPKSVLVSTCEISSDTEIGIFEQFYKKNNELRYCNGSYFKFQDDKWAEKYAEWLNSDDYKKKSFYLYYGNGVVD